MAYEVALDELVPRLASAELSVAADDLRVQFGHEVELASLDGKGSAVTVRIVGVDEADPDQGAISYLAPLSQALLGLKPGDEVSLGPSGRRMTIARIG